MNQQLKQEGLTSSLPPLETYQQDAIDFISSNWAKGINSLCALDVGMGKTRVACEIIARVCDTNADVRLKGYVLICCSTSGVRDTIWAETLQAYSLDTIICEGEQFQRKKLQTKKKLSIPPMTTCLITYANLYTEENIKYFINSPPTLIVFDEYHTITNNSSRDNQSYRNAVLQLPKSLRLGLTATPFINNEMETLIAYGLLNDTKLVKKFYDSEKKGRDKLTEEVSKKISVFLFYRSNPYQFQTANEWAISIPMGKKLYTQYLSLIEKTQYSSYMKRQHAVGKISVSPSLLSNTNVKIMTGKALALKLIIENLPDGDKIVIFDTYRDTLKYIKKLDFIRPLKPLLYLGGQKMENKKVLDKFTNDVEHRALLATRQEGGEGLNLQNANHLVLMNCWYTAKDIIQIFGRVKRKGQKKPVYAYLLGYNLFDCLGMGRKNPKDYFLKEEWDYYKAVNRKTEMCEQWGIEIEAKLPLTKPFFSESTFEKEFNAFLQKIIIPKATMIESDKIQIEIENSKEEYKHQDALRKVQEEQTIKSGQAVFEYLCCLYYSALRNQEQKKQRKKVVVIKKKHRT
ncbi:MAG: DEAD/DEAH box helicase [Treponema sp.]|nr:DEAD/DEAH box helicase [Treponema sp.]